MAFKNILLATDGSANAKRALAVAAELAAQHDARLVVLHAVITHAVPDGLREWARVEHLLDEPEPPRAEGPAYGRLGVIPKSQGGFLPHRARVALGQAIVEHAADEARKAGVKTVESYVEDGDPAEVIQHVLERETVDLIVLGTRGLGQLKGLLVGSVSQKIVGLHHCPVLTVP